VVVTQRDRLLEKIPDLGPAARPLAVRGVPRVVQLPGWIGPTFFSSELGDGRIRTLEAFAPSAVDGCEVSGWVVGSVREPLSWSAEEASAAFVIQRRTGHVLLVDLEGGGRPAFVNSSAALFLDAIDVFLQWWQSLRGTEAGIRRIREDLARLDGPAMAAPGSFWPQWLDDLRGL
jgi:hypothetical protein